MCAFCPGRLRRRNDRGRFNTSSPFDASVDVTDARGRVRNPDKPSRASGGLMKSPARALSRYRPIIGWYVRLLPCPGKSPPFPDAGSSPAQPLRYAQDGKCSSTPVSLRKQRMKSATSTEVVPK